jgi:hypothetical protein
LYQVIALAMTLTDAKGEGLQALGLNAHSHSPQRLKPLPEGADFGIAKAMP